MSFSEISKQPLFDSSHNFPNVNNIQNLDNDLKKSYFKTLHAMKIAHFKTYFDLQNSAKEGVNCISLPRLFRSFHPCPLRLILIEFCKKPLNVNTLPEIFEGCENAFGSLHREYQKLNFQSRRQLLECIIEDAESKFIDALDDFIEKIEEGPHSTTISFLLHSFEKEVQETKELIDFLKPSIRDEQIYCLFQENRQAAESSWTRAIFSFFSSTQPASCTPLQSRYICDLNRLKADYGSICHYSQYLLDREIKSEDLRLRHDPLPTKILAESRRIASEIVYT